MWWSEQHRPAREIEGNRTRFPNDLLEVDFISFPKTRQNAIPTPRILLHKTHTHTQLRALNIQKENIRKRRTFFDRRLRKKKKLLPNFAKVVESVFPHVPTRPPPSRCGPGSPPCMLRGSIPGLPPPPMPLPGGPDILAPGPMPGGGLSKNCLLLLLFIAPSGLLDIGPTEPGPPTPPPFQLGPPVAGPPGIEPFIPGDLVMSRREWRRGQSCIV